MDWDGPPPDQEFTTGGDFASTGGGKGPAHYGLGVVTLNANEELLIECETGSSAGGHTFTLASRGDGTTFTRQVAVGGSLLIRGRGIQTVLIDSADANVIWVRAPYGALPTSFFGLSAITVPTSVTVPANVDVQTFPPTSIAGATAEAVSQAGANPIPAGTLVYFRLNVEGAIITAADQFTYIALKGHTSNTYFAVCYTGPAGNMTGTFRMTGAGEAIDIVTRNQDTVAHVYSGMWEAWTGV